jgi:preprotein translocase subunit SecD
VKRGPLIASIVLTLSLVAASLWAFLGGGVQPQLGLDLVGGVSVVLTAPPGTPQDVMEKTVETIRERVDALGVAEPDITLQGDLNIQVQIPRFEGDSGGGRSQERLLELVGQTARLEFREVRAEVAPGTPEYGELEITRGEEAEGPVVFPASDTPEGEDPILYQLGRVLMTGDAIARASAIFNDPATVTDSSSAGWVVDFTLDGTGATRFGEVTRQLNGKQMAIVLDRRVESAPFVNEPITGGRGTITLGNGTAPEAEQEAKDLALVLRVGALPVELEQSQVETVSPTLGEESLREGLIAGIAGLIALAIYLAFYYRLLGLVTWLGMAIWAVLTVGIVSVLGVTVGYSLTLAGVAGLVVSIGVTADSYIVFYERLKDDVRHGKTLRSAVQPAFRRAWRTIVAADIVTALAAVVLYLLAIGSVRGFALTLGLATLLDLFVVYFFKRPTVFLIARSRRLSDLPGMGLRSGVAATGHPEPVAGGGR